MKIIIALFITLSLNSIVYSQSQVTEPLIIQGKLINSPERRLKIFFEDENEKIVLDTIKLNEQGEFYLKTYKIIKPQRTNIQQNATQINNIYVAPGYNLTITGDGKDFLSLMKTKKITGIGSEVNQFRVKVDSIYALKRDSTGWYDLDLQPLLVYTKKKRAFDDSIAGVVFNKKAQQDKYFNTFKRMIQMDNESMQFYMVLEHFFIKKYSYDSIIAVVKANTPNAFVKGISNEEYLLSPDYKTWLLRTYVDYKKLLDKLKDSALVKKPGYDLAKTNELLTGKVRDLYLYRIINSRIGTSSSIEKLNATRKDVEVYITTIKSEGQKKVLLEAFDEKEQQLLVLQIGKPAPGFKLVSHAGKTYQLSDFKGKVIYFDLWASWCGPCRQEIPNFKKLYSKYKDNNKIAFIGVAVFDGEKEWRNALEADKPEWLQFYDKDGIIAKSYAASAIPKYIMIDKNGNLVNFDAPGPGDVEAIENLINKEIAKETL